MKTSVHTDLNSSPAGPALGTCLHRDAVQDLNLAFKTLCVQGKGKDERGGHLVAPLRLLSLNSHFAEDRLGNLNSLKTTVNLLFKRTGMRSLPSKAKSFNKIILLHEQIKQKVKFTIPLLKEGGLPFPYALSSPCFTQPLNLQTCFLFFFTAALESKSCCAAVLLPLAFSIASSSEGSNEKKEGVLLVFHICLLSLHSRIGVRSSTESLSQ